MGGKLVLVGKEAGAYRHTIIHMREAITDSDSQHPLRSP